MSTIGFRKRRGHQSWKIQE